MKISFRMVVTMTVFISGFCLCAVAQNHPVPSELVQKLHSVESTDEARKQLLSLGKAEPDVRRHLATELPAMIQAGPKSCPPSEISDVVKRWHTCPWFNAVELAGQLKIAEAVPALAPWVGWRAPAPLLPAMEEQLLFHPAAKALAEIGDPAIPVLKRVLNSRNPEEHAKAVRALCIIRTPNAKAVLRDNLAHESDRDLQTMIKNALRE